MHVPSRISVLGGAGRDCFQVRQKLWIPAEPPSCWVAALTGNVLHWPLLVFTPGIRGVPAQWVIVSMAQRGERNPPAAPRRAAPPRKPLGGVQPQSPKVWVGRCLQYFPSLHLPVFAHFEDPYTCKSVNSPVLRIIGNVVIKVHFSTYNHVLFEQWFQKFLFFLRVTAKIWLIGNILSILL